MAIQSSSRHSSSAGKQFTFPTKASSPTEAYLQQLSYKFLDILCNDKNLSHPFLQKHMSADFFNNGALDDEGSTSRGRESHLTTWQQMLSEIPSLYMDMVDIQPDVDASGLRANVWCWKRSGGMSESPGCFRKESVSIQYWELRDKVWTCVKMKSLLGVSGI